MSLAALLIPVDAEPIVVAADRWDIAAIARQLDCSTSFARIIPLGYSPAADKSLIMAINPQVHTPVNDRACALAGPQSTPIAGSVLLVAVRHTGQAVNLAREDLASLALRLVIDEAVYGILPPPQ